MTIWEKATEWERNWWGNCNNTFMEESKQIVYTKYLGLEFERTDKTFYEINMEGASVLDIGGGPISLLLKCVNVDGTVADPCKYPEWVYERYKGSGIKVDNRKGEDLIFEDKVFDEVWMYNVLQHVEDPEKIIKNARKCSKMIRFVDWPYTPAMPDYGHPNCLQPEKMDEWLGGEGKVEAVNDRELNTQIYHGIFKGEWYGK